MNLTNLVNDNIILLALTLKELKDNYVNLLNKDRCLNTWSLHLSPASCCCPAFISLLLMTFSFFASTATC